MSAGIEQEIQEPMIGPAEAPPAPPAPAAVQQIIEKAEAAVLAAAPAPAEQAQPEPFVLDQASRYGQQRTVQVLGDCGVFCDDEARGAIMVAKRINHCLFGDFSRENMSDTLLTQIRSIQTKYRGLVKSASYDALVESGELNQLLDDYTSFHIAKSTEKLARLKEGELKGDELNPAILNSLIEAEQKKLVDLRGEQATYRSGGDYTKQTLRRIEPLVKLDKYTPLGKLVIQSGFVKGEPALASDLVSDVLGTVAARRLMMLSQRLGSSAYMNKLAEKAEDSSTQARMQAMADAVRQSTQPVASLFEFEREVPELDRINALNMLASAQVHQAFSQKRSLPQMVELEKQAQAVLADYAQTALSLSYHYLANGAASGDSRVQKIQTNLKAEMDRSGIALLPLNDAKNKAEKLARASAEDLLVVVGADEQLSAKVKSLAHVIGVPQRAPLAPKSQLIGVEISNVDKNLNYILPMTLLKNFQERVATGLNNIGISM